MKDIRGEIKVDPNVELKDYSGPFKPDLRYTDFSREQLAKLYKLAHEYFMDLMDAFSLYILGKYGLDAVVEAHNEIWFKGFNANSQKMFSEGLNVPGNDIESMMKALQVDPAWGPVKFKVTYEMPSKDRGVITVHHCPEVCILEDLGQEELLEVFCGKLDPDIMEDYARCFNPDIVTKCVERPPRKSKDDIYCRWEFTYKAK